MKKLIYLVLFGCWAATAVAQVPQKMNYQAVIRDASQALLSSAPVGVRISILQGSATGTAVYVETHNGTTNANGLLTLEIGAGTAQTGTFAGIDWSLAPYFLQTETDPTGGTNYTLITISEMLSVPYALYAATSGNPIPGKSAYQTWLELGNVGTETDFINSLTGPQGTAGTNGQSAYDIWLSLGNTGTETDFVNSLTGPQGAQGPQGPQGTPGANGTNGTNGDGAYTNWLNQGNTGTEADFLATLVGPQGPPGATLVNGGKHALILMDNITDAQAAQQIVDEVGPNTEEIVIAGCTVLTTVDLSSLVGKVIRISVVNCPELASLKLGGVTHVYDLVEIINCPKLTVVDISALKYIAKGGFKMSQTAVANLDLSLLESLSYLTIFKNTLLTTLNTSSLRFVINVNIAENPLLNAVSMPIETYPTNFDASGFQNGVPSIIISIEKNRSIQQISLNSLKYCYWLKLGYSPNLTDINLAGLDSVAYSMDCTNDSSLVNLNLSSLKNSGNLSFLNCVAIVTLDLPVYKDNLTIVAMSNYRGSFTLDNCNSLSSINVPMFVPSQRNAAGSMSLSATKGKLPSSEINKLLAILVQMPNFGSSFVNLSGQTPPAPPTGQGITDKSSLISRGWYVTTD